MKCRCPNNCGNQGSPANLEEFQVHLTDWWEGVGCNNRSQTMALYLNSVDTMKRAHAALGKWLAEQEGK